jgi:hypothetical protein
MVGQAVRVLVVLLVLVAKKMSLAAQMAGMGATYLVRMGSAAVVVEVVIEPLILGDHM